MRKYNKTNILTTLNMKFVNRIIYELKELDTFVMGITDSKGNLIDVILPAEIDDICTNEEIKKFKKLLIVNADVFEVNLIS